MGGLSVGSFEVESESEHPLARAIVAAAETRGLLIPTASAFRSIAGRGVEATVGDDTVAVGGPALLRERSLREPDSIERRTDEWRGRGASVLHVVRNEDVVGALALEDEIRAESEEAIDGLHSLGVRVVMITGDAHQVAESVAATLGIDEVFAEVLPEAKGEAVSNLQARGLVVAMVGDHRRHRTGRRHGLLDCGIQDCFLGGGVGHEVPPQEADDVLDGGDGRVAVAIDEVDRRGVEGLYVGEQIAVLGPQRFGRSSIGHVVLPDETRLQRDASAAQVIGPFVTSRWGWRRRPALPHGCERDRFGEDRASGEAVR
jgi:Cu2+-exporting ATPase